MRALFVCSTGGHLWEMLHWSQRLDPIPDSVVWATHDRANAHQIFALDPGAEVHYVRPVDPKQAGAASVVLGAAWRLLGRTRPDVVVSTGAAVAVPFALAARARGIPFHYLESAARISGPSLTGRIVARVSGQPPSSQSPRSQSPHSHAGSWARWQYAGSLFDAYATSPAAGRGPLRRVVVALGTQNNFGFRSAVESIARVLSTSAVPPEVLWQVGSTDVRGLPVTDPRVHVAEADLLAAMCRADVVITHAGVGLAAMALDSGHVPVLLPRRAARREHTDDHQSELAQLLGARGLGVPVETGTLDLAHLNSARARVVSRRPVTELSTWLLHDARTVSAGSARRG